ncbi:MAG: FAD-binding protein, partial [Proteobacteria bacterium]|nr:FAD-binding protein [Pseudomonadota bacterium]
FAIFDDRSLLHASQFADFRSAEAQGAVIRANSLSDLEAALGLPSASLTAELDTVSPGEPDRFGRVFGDRPLAAPYCAVRVTGALFHTQGGLAVDGTARVRRAGGGVFANLFAAGGAACGVSGSGDAGYLSGNGLLAASVLGRIAGQSA